MHFCFMIPCYQWKSMVLGNKNMTSPANIFSSIRQYPFGDRVVIFQPQHNLFTSYYFFRLLSMNTSDIIVV